jgi:hypothetical protein
VSDVRTRPASPEGAEGGRAAVYSLYGVNQLPPEERDATYRRLVPEELVAPFGLDLRDALRVSVPADGGSVELDVRTAPDAEDPLFYLHLADTTNMQIELLLIVINDPRAPRFNIDHLAGGEQTEFGTTGRNLAAEIAAQQAGLAPGQVRAGRRGGRRAIECLDRFAGELGHSLVILQPLAYHNAILFERWGFTYVSGHQLMTYIDAEFRPGGFLHSQLDGSTPFRMPDAWRSVRGRSWAIHDGVLGEPFTGVEMYKTVAKHAGVNTFTGENW